MVWLEYDKFSRAGVEEFTVPHVISVEFSRVRVGITVRVEVYVIDDIIIKKGINYILSEGNSTAKWMYYLHLQSINDRRHSLKLTLKL